MMLQQTLFDCHIHKWVNSIIFFFIFRNEQQKPKSFTGHFIKIASLKWNSIKRYGSRCSLLSCLFFYEFGRFFLSLFFNPLICLMRINFIFLSFILSLPTIISISPNERTKISLELRKLVCLYTFFSLFPQPELPLVDTHITRKTFGEFNETNNGLAKK